MAHGTLDRAAIHEQLAVLRRRSLSVLGGELIHHLGDEKGEMKSAGGTNSRNGSRREWITVDDDTARLRAHVDQETRSVHPDRP
ncbi:hypothetical protein WS62_06885 [Burkholderia sp. ABCPW 14]|uniref:hypothetical protein n=1 Tax=Burkholderia sp. ABCPW 14 TaxID=1637860 RepID=UPI000770D349|nr:hypothetical protein [Burkholderia sp. ABCPW 14]KVD74186.1 hypothetical protein WS62_06885 [Burkholderia sp. ABCPW 14]